MASDESSLRPRRCIEQPTSNPFHFAGSIASPRRRADASENDSLYAGGGVVIGPDQRVTAIEALRAITITRARSSPASSQTS